ncbi:uncharacterized protein DEA37_0005069 [Paragonimus westermani]|uniref:Uncharacterized protein n=1 Tax=Paragonimus westermani TaxID=34504 RepID=A0A5J4N6M1_9TREM|nr:uncharacterized protein DEA37_0005069 [Paragonimus westermani]
MCTSKLADLLPAVVTWALILGVTTLYFVFICFQFSATYSWVIFVIHSILTIYVLCCLIRTSFMDPGFFPYATEEEVDYEESKSALGNREYNINGYYNFTALWIEFLPSARTLGVPCIFDFKWCYDQRAGESTGVVL